MKQTKNKRKNCYSWIDKIIQEIDKVELKYIYLIAMYFLYYNTISK